MPGGVCFRTIAKLYFRQDPWLIRRGRCLGRSGGGPGLAGIDLLIVSRNGRVVNRQVLDLKDEPMLKRIFHLLDKSGSEHEDQRRLHLTFLVIAVIIMLFSAPLTIRAVGTSIYFGFIGLLLISLALAYMNQLWLTRVITPLAAFLLVTRLVYGGGIHDDSVGGYYFILLVAGLMLGQRAMLLFGVLSTLAIIAIGLAETSGLIVTHFSPLTERATIATTAFFMRWGRPCRQVCGPAISSAAMAGRNLSWFFRA